MSDNSEMVFAGDERRELAYSMGEGVGSIPLSGLVVRPIVWFYVNVQLKLVSIVFSLIQKRELGERLVADNEVIMDELMAGFRGEQPLTESESADA
ncbi:hypothetical protein [Halosimplex halobium]|uniref:hypothetical protein n=1 Tax=Halosimplex halobium TaxID=3396618 RepID=UPI003F56ECE3